MNRRKLRIWVLGILIVAGVVAFVRSRTGGDEVTVLIVNPKSGQPLTNVVVSVTEVYRIPVISSLPFIPEAWRWHSRISTLDYPVSMFRVPRVSKRGSLQEVEATVFERAEVDYHWKRVRWFWTRDTVLPEKSPLVIEASYLW